MRRSIALVLLVLALPAAAVNTSHWVHTNEADFKKGTFRNVVATNLGDLKLSRAVKTILEQDAKVGAVYCMAEAADGTIYAGTGPHGVLLAVRGDKVSTIYEPEGMENVFSLLVDKAGRILMGTGGVRGRIMRINDPAKRGVKPEEIFAEKDVQYVWAIRQTPDGNLYVATGPNGQLFEMKADGSKSVLLDSDENNVMSLVSDGKDLLYAGTDPNGLVYRINRKTKDVFVLFDAPESEVGALALDAKGNLYAGTAEASEKQPAAPGAADEGAKEKSGRPEGTGGVPIPAQPPENPKPPALPPPNPGEPDPIPKKVFLPDAPVDHDSHPEVLRRISGLRAGIVVPSSFAALRMTGAQSTAVCAGNDLQRLFAGDEPGDEPAPPAPPKPGPPGKRPQPGKPAPVNAATPPAPGGIPPAPEPIDFGKPKPEGNAIYRIDPDGFVREIFRQPVMVMSMVERGGVLLVGTGGDGLIYQVDPAAEETVVLANVDPKQVLCMLPARDGRILLGMANVGGIASMSSGYAADGAFTSPVLDAAQISRFGKLHLNGSLPKETGLTIATRSGNLQDPEKAGWSGWSAEAPAVSFAQVASPSARFFQYRLTFTSKGGVDSPVVDEVDVAYQLPNLAPVVKTVKIGAGEANKLGSLLTAGLEGLGGAAAAAPPKAATPRNPVEAVTWEVEDANADAVTYALYFRSGSKSPWILLKDKLTESHFEWDTRTVADGRYEVKVVASDQGANVVGQGRSGSRVSDPVVVDNTPPAIGDIRAEAKGATARVRASVVDRGTTVASLEYSVDAMGDWQAVLPSDNIFDGPEEKVDFTISKLTPGPHQITLRAGDAKGNHAYETVLVTIEAQAGK
jgi:hypothetical protein